MSLPVGLIWSVWICVANLIVFIKHIAWNSLYFKIISKENYKFSQLPSWGIDGEDVDSFSWAPFLEIMYEHVLFFGLFATGA